MNDATDDPEAGSAVPNALVVVQALLELIVRPPEDTFVEI
jgi:hypothetical protein